MITPYQMEQIKCKFFQYDVGYKKFQGITTERLEEIKKDIERFEEITFDPKRSKYEGKLDRYYRILAHLTTRRDYTFDEKVAFVIMACDPNQVLYVDYKKFDIQSNASIEKIEDQEEKIAAKQYNDMLITELASGVRDKIGFYEPKLLRFEEGFYKKFTKELIPYSGKDYGDTLFKLPHDFTSMSATDYLFCKSQVSRYLSKVENVDIDDLQYF